MLHTFPCENLFLRALCMCCAFHAVANVGQKRSRAKSVFLFLQIFYIGNMPAAKTLLLLPAMLALLPSYAQTAGRFDVVITEIMADPTPVAGLPNAEYIELKNISAAPINLTGWRLSDATGTATIITGFVLAPDSIVILCANSQVAAFSAFGRSIGVTSFPSLDNDGELLSLRSPQNRVIHAVHYAADWYGNDVKKEGGWSLEMIDPQSPCVGKENWKASVNATGGTPGKTNSVNSTNPDNTPPQVKKAYAPDSLTLVVVLNEPLDSTTAAMAVNYSLPGNTVVAATPLPPLYQRVQLTLQAPLQKSMVYTLTVSQVQDCKGNAVGSYNQAKAGLSQSAAAAGIVINEILFHPKPGAYDYVELYNRSTAIVDAAQLYLANRNSSGAASSLRKLADEPFYLFPGDYAVVTENSGSLQKEFLVKQPDGVLPLSSLPSYPNDRGTVVLLTYAGDVVDEVAYDKAWHFALLSNPEGVALERLHPDAPSQNAASWHSAASTAGYGTPTYRNSQYSNNETVQAMLTVSPAVFSPDNDGRDDIATIQYKAAQSGFVANVFIFDAGGRLVRHLVKNDLLGLSGFWKWDGLGETQNKLPIGTYIVFTELFTTGGKKQSFKNTVVLARPLN